jgi:serine protease AprX
MSRSYAAVRWSFSALAWALAIHGAPLHAVPTDALEDDRWLRVDLTRAELVERIGEVDSIDYGRFQWLQSPDVSRRALLGDARAVAIDNPFILDLGGERFDPLLSPPAHGELVPRFTGSEDKPDWHLVQFKGPIKQEWLEHLTAAGLEPVQYIHPFTYVVWGMADRLGSARLRSEVRWTGNFLATYAVLPDQPGPGDVITATMVLVSNDRIDELRSVASTRGGLIGTITRINRFLSVMHLSLARSSYMELASMPGIYSIQRSPAEGGIRGEVSGQSLVAAVDAVGRVAPGYLDWLDALGYDGRGVIAGVVDEVGFRRTHLDLVDNVVSCGIDGKHSCSPAGAANAHATHVAGAIGGRGVTATVDDSGFLRGLGIAPGVGLVSQTYVPYLGGGSMVADGMLRIFKDSALSGAQLVNNSWGPTSIPQGYDIPTMQVDIISRDANSDTLGSDPILAVWSIMNGGGDRPTGICAPSSLASPDEAKNLLAVGSTYLLDNAGNQLGRPFDVSYNSAHGNACDGRRVPHIVAPGCNTDSTVGSSDTAHSHGGDGNVTSRPAGFCGTSMASPNVTGAAALFIQQYRDLHAGATPSPALVKAAFTAVATDLSGHRDADDRVMGHRPDRFQGYGRLDMAAALRPSEPVLYWDQTEVFTDTGQDWQRTISAVDPGQPIRIMLAWTDAHGHGLGGTTPAWVNDLDLMVDAAGVTYWGNAVGADGWSSADGSADGMNNLEGIFLAPNQHQGSIELSVLAANIATDALNPFDPDGDAPRQDFAVVCYNCIEGSAPEPGTADLAVILTTSTAQVPAGGDVVIDVAASSLGPGAVDHVHLRVTLPDPIDPRGARAVEVPEPVPGAGAWSCVYGEAIDCRLTSGLASGASAPVLRLTAPVRVDATTGRVAGSARITGSRNDDPNPGNDTSTVDILIEGQGDDLFIDGFECGTDTLACGS